MDRRMAWGNSQYPWGECYCVLFWLHAIEKSVLWFFAILSLSVLILVIRTLIMLMIDAMPAGNSLYLLVVTLFSGSTCWIQCTSGDVIKIIVQNKNENKERVTISHLQNKCNIPRLLITMKCTYLSLLTCINQLE